MKSYIKTVLIIVPLFLSGNIFAQKQWKLEDCIGYALQNNITIKRQALQTEIADNNLTQSKIDLLPDLNAGGNHTFGSGNILDNSYQFTNSLNNGSFGLQSNFMLFNGFQKINTVKMNKYNFMSTVQNLEKIKNDISINIASGYLQILYTKELRDVANSELEVTKMQVEKTKKLFEVGNVAKGSLFEIQATAATEEASLTDAQNNLNLAYLSLAQMLDLDTVKNFTVFIPEEISVPEAFSDNPDSIYRIALSNLPQIKSAEFSLLVAKSQLSIANGSRSPQLSLSASYSTRYDFNGKKYIYNAKDSLIAELPYPIKNQLNDNLFKQVAINLSIPIFTKYQIQKNISNAKIGVKDAEFALRQNQLQLRKDIEQAYANALASFQNYKTRSEEVTSTGENFKYVQQKFDVGLVNSVDYNVAKKDFVKAQSDLLYAKYDFIFKTKILEFYKGNAIKL
jgi:outer membrane protein